MRQVTVKIDFALKPLVAIGRELGFILFILLLFSGPFRGHGQELNRKTPTLKLAPVLQNKALRTTRQKYRILVKNPQAFARWLQQALPQVTVNVPSLTNRTLTLSGVTPAALNILLQSPEVQFVDVPDRPAQEELLLNQADLVVNKINAVHAQYPQYNGAGLAASVKENPFDTTDLDLKNRIIQTAAFNKTPSSHATTMATLLAGGANSGLGGQGVAPQARLATSDFSNLMPDAVAGFRAEGISVQNHSYGVQPENYYGLETQAYDQQTQDNPDLLHVFSAGNAGTERITTGTYANMPGWANMTGQFKIAKNVLTVGATDTSGHLNPISSRGPTYDGRLKPEIVAFGQGGSSESAALVSGMALLVQQAYLEQNNVLPAAALVKAALINSADPLANNALSFSSGYGQADALGAVAAIRNKHYLNGELNNNQATTFTIPVPENANFLKITLVWHDRAAEPNAAKALVNDLDLTAVHLNSRQLWLPWVLSTYPHPDSLALPPRRAADHLNNVEQITIAKPASGRYEVQVKGYRVSSGPQPFSVVYEIIPANVTWINPGKQSWLVAGERNRIRWENQTNATIGKLEYRFFPQGTWQVITENTNLAQSFLDWQAPDTVTLAQLRLTTGNLMALSDTFGLYRPLNLQIGYNCGNDALLFWPQQLGASAYQIYQLGAVSLEPYEQTRDTLVVLNKNLNGAVHYAVAPVVQGLIGPKSITRDYTQEPCYITSFLPRQLVTDSVTLDAALSTNYGLQSITLEKKIGGVFRAIQTTNNIEQLNFAFSDFAPSPGRNEYRLKVTTQNQADYYSQTEGVFFAAPPFLQLFPNPVIRGTEVNVVVASDAETRIEIMDALGRTVNAVNEAGVIKTISTANLVAGVYLVRVQNQAKQAIIARLVVL